MGHRCHCQLPGRFVQSLCDALRFGATAAVAIEADRIIRGNIDARDANLGQVLRGASRRRQSKRQEDTEPETKKRSAGEHK